MEKHKELDETRASLLEMRGELLDAAEVHITLRHISEAAALMRRVLASLRQHLLLGSSCTESDTALALRLATLSNLDTKLIKKNEREEVL